MSTNLVEMAANGRLVIPLDARKTLGVQASGHFRVSVENGSIVLTPVAIVPVDRGFPITDELVGAAGRAAAEDGAGVSRSDVRRRLRQSRSS